MTKKTSRKKTSRKKKRYINAQFLWLLSALAGAALLISFSLMEMFPGSWTLILGGVLAVILFVTLILSSRNQKSYAVKTVNLVLCGAMLVLAVLMPVYQNKISDLFNIVTGNVSNINFYVINTMHLDLVCKPSFYFDYKHTGILNQKTDIIFSTIYFSIIIDNNII